MILTEGVDTNKLNASSMTDIGASMNVDVDIRMGLWMTSVCADIGFGKTCETVSTTRLEATLGQMSSGSPGSFIL